MAVVAGSTMHEETGREMTLRASYWYFFILLANTLMVAGCGASQGRGGACHLRPHTVSMDMRGDAESVEFWHDDTGTRVQTAAQPLFVDTRCRPQSFDRLVEAAYCEDRDFEGYIQDVYRSAFPVFFPRTEWTKFDTYFYRRWSLYGVPSGCERTGASRRIDAELVRRVQDARVANEGRERMNQEELARLQALREAAQRYAAFCEELDEAFLTDSGFVEQRTPMQLDALLEQGENCENKALHRYAVALGRPNVSAQHVHGLARELAESYAQLSSRHPVVRWMENSTQQQVCSSRSFAILKYYEALCSAELELEQREHLKGRLIRDFRSVGKVRSVYEPGNIPAIEVLFSNGERFVFDIADVIEGEPLTPRLRLSPYAEERGDDATLCQIATAATQDVFRAGDVMQNDHWSYEVASRSIVTCDEAIHREDGGRSIQGRFEHQAKDTISAVDGRVQGTFAADFMPVELPSGQWWELQSYTFDY